jgi:hypothetical protein
MFELHPTPEVANFIGHARLGAPWPSVLVCTQNGHLEFLLVVDTQYLCAHLAGLGGFGGRALWPPTGTAHAAPSFSLSMKAAISAGASKNFLPSLRCGIRFAHSSERTHQIVVDIIFAAQRISTNSGAIGGACRCADSGREILGSTFLGFFINAGALPNFRIRNYSSVQHGSLRWKPGRTSPRLRFQVGAS